VLIHSKTHSLLQRIKVIIGNIIKCTDNRGWVRRLKESSGQRVEQLAPAVAQRPVNFIGNHPTGDLYGHKVALMKPMPNVSTRYHHYARDFGVEISTSIDHQDAGYDDAAIQFHAPEDDDSEGLYCLLFWLKMKSEMVRHAGTRSVLLARNI
jgi:hypothetical protein